MSDTPKSVGLRAKNGLASQAVAQMFPNDAISHVGGAVLFLFALLAIATAALACTLAYQLKKRTIQAYRDLPITQDVFNQITSAWPSKFPNTKPPVRQQDGQYIAKAIQTTPVCDLYNGTMGAALACTSGCMFVPITGLLLITFLIVLRPKAPYGAAVIAWAVGLLWLANALVFVTSYVKSSIVPYYYISYLNAQIANGEVINTSLMLDSMDVTLLDCGDNIIFSKAFVGGSIALLGLFAVIVMVARFTDYERSE